MRINTLLPLLILVLPVAALLAFANPYHCHLTPALSDEIASAQGGACLDCMHGRGSECIADSCTKIADGVWRKTTGMKVTSNVCFQVDPGKPGTTTCKNDTPKVCLKKRTCTQAGCPDGSCGPESTTEVDTNCRLGTYLCNG